MIALVHPSCRRQVNAKFSPSGVRNPKKKEKPRPLHFPTPKTEGPIGWVAWCSSHLKSLPNVAATSVPEPSGFTSNQP